MQLYIKARGLDHVRFGSIVENGSQINLNKLRKILSSLKMPTVTRSPVHLEIIIQVEGKTILFFFLNQQSFNALTEGDSKYRQFLKATHFIDLIYFSPRKLCVFFRMFSAESSDEIGSHGQSHQSTKFTMSIPFEILCADCTWNANQFNSTKYRTQFTSW